MITDEELGRAIRTIAASTSAGFDRFEYYAKFMVKTAEDLANGLWTPGKVTRVQVRVEPTDQLDGLIEHVVEMFVGVQCGTANMRGEG